MIYLDNNATTKPSKKVIDTIVDYYENRYGNASSSNSFGNLLAEDLEECRQAHAHYIKSRPSEIIFTSGATESNNLVLKNINKKVLTIPTEHKSVLQVSNNIEYVKIDSQGYIDLDDLEYKIPGAGLVTIAHGNNEIGTIQDIKQISKICKRHKVLLHSDMTQTLGKIDIDVTDLGVDFASFSAHKNHGPKGVGSLFISRKYGFNNINPQMLGGGQENGIRAGTINLPGIAGFIASLEPIDANIARLRDRMLEQLLTIENVSINGPTHNRLCTNINIEIEGISGEILISALKDVIISTGSACMATGAPSHVLKAIGLSDKSARSSVRISLSRYTTEAEIDIAATEIKRAVRQIRGF